MTNDVIPDVSSGSVARVTRSFTVTWRNTVQRITTPIAELHFDGKLYGFRYLEDARNGAVPGFRPFLGFPDLDRVYSSNKLWPFFALRVMDRRRPDYPRYVEWLGLPPAPSPLDVLSRSGGERKGDSVQLIEQPTVSDVRSTEYTFLVRGARYAADDYGSGSVVENLLEGSSLGIQADLSNPSNAKALWVTTTEGQPLGWVPDSLIPYVSAVWASEGARLELVRDSGALAPWHLRLLVRLVGRVPEGFELFPARAPDKPTATRLH